VAVEVTTATVEEAEVPLPFHPAAVAHVAVLLEVAVHVAVLLEVVDRVVRVVAVLVVVEAVLLVVEVVLEAVEGVLMRESWEEAVTVPEEAEAAGPFRSRR